MEIGQRKLFSYNNSPVFLFSLVFKFVCGTRNVSSPDVHMCIQKHAYSHKPEENHMDYTRPAQF